MAGLLGDKALAKAVQVQTARLPAGCQAGAEGWLRRTTARTAPQPTSRYAVVSSCPRGPSTLHRACSRTRRSTARTSASSWRSTEAFLAYHAQASLSECRCDAIVNKGSPSGPRHVLTTIVQIQTSGKWASAALYCETPQQPTAAHCPTPCCRQAEQRTLPAPHHGAQLNTYTESGPLPWRSSSLPSVYMP